MSLTSFKKPKMISTNCFVVPKKSSKSKMSLIYNNIKQRKSANTQINQLILSTLLHLY